MHLESIRNFSQKDHPLCFTRTCSLPGITYVLADFMCRFRTRSPMFACGGLAVAWEWLETTLGVLGLWFGSAISWFHGMIWWYDHIILWYEHATLWYNHVRLWCDRITLWYDPQIRRPPLRGPPGCEASNFILRLCVSVCSGVCRLQSVDDGLGGPKHPNHPQPSMFSESHLPLEILKKSPLKRHPILLPKID